jgi:hypothetical protein
MTLVECFEYAMDVGEPAVPAWPGYAALLAQTRPATVPRREAVRQRRIQPATWVVIALAIPVLCWDIWQTERDVAVRRQTSMQHARISATLSAPSLPDQRPHFRPW